VGAGKKINYFPSKKVRLTVDARKCVENGIVPPSLADKIVPYIEWEISQNALFQERPGRARFLAANDWERALYTANPSSLAGFLASTSTSTRKGWCISSYR